MKKYYLSNEIYKKTGYRKGNYSRWCNTHLLPLSNDKNDNRVLFDRILPNGQIIYKVSGSYAKQLLSERQTIREANKAISNSHESNTPDYEIIIHDINQRLFSLENENKELKKLIKKMFSQPGICKEAKSYSSFYKKMLPKYQALEKYFNCTRRELYRNLFLELENLLNIDINVIFDNYCFENGLDPEKTFTMSAIEADENLRQMIESIVDDAIAKANIPIKRSYNATFFNSL